MIRILSTTLLLSISIIASFKSIYIPSTVSVIRLKWIYLINSLKMISSHRLLINHRRVSFKSTKSIPPILSLVCLLSVILSIWLFRASFIRDFRIIIMPNKCSMISIKCMILTLLIYFRSLCIINSAVPLIAHIFTICRLIHYRIKNKPLNTLTSTAWNSELVVLPVISRII